jgi:hypothetical protein
MRTGTRTERGRARAALAGTLALLIALLLAGPAAERTSAAEEPLEIFDAHLHYNWEPKPFLPIADVLALFKRTRVTGILATSRPNDGTHALAGAKADGLWVVPFIRPYRVRADIASWMGDPTIYDLVQEELKRGYYQGIGEFHLSGRAAANPWVKRIVDLAVERGLFLHCHCDAEALEILYEHNRRARVVWAHTGFSLEPERVEALLKTYPELWGELSYRGGISDGGGKLSPAWRGLFERHPDRFLIGSDTWINERWASYEAIIAGYRLWLADLPPIVARRIASGNAKALFAGQGKAAGQ